MNELVRSFVTIKEMLSDRGVDTNLLDAISDVELAAMANASNVFTVTVSDSFKIMYYLNTKFKITELTKKFDPTDTVLMVFKEKINNQNIKNIKELNAHVEVFMLKELQYNISRHVLVPKHEIVRDEQFIENMLATYRLKKNQLPIIQKTDPMARYLRVAPGDLVKITRSSPSAGEAVVYRYCV